MSLALRPLGEADLPEFRRLLGGEEFGGCFCAVWASFDQTWTERCSDPRQPNFRITSDRVRAGNHVGFLVYEEQAVVGWTGSGPKPAFPLLREKLASRLGPVDDSVWSVGCVAIAVPFRGRGLTNEIIRLVIAKAAAHGARSVEAYPTRPRDEARSYRGGYRSYERLGFRICATEEDGDTEILLMKLDL